MRYYFSTIKFVSSNYILLHYTCTGETNEIMIFAGDHYLASTLYYNIRPGDQNYIIV